MVRVKVQERERGGDAPVGAEVIPENMDYREEIPGLGDVEGESIVVGSRGEFESKMVDSLLNKESSQIVSELEEKDRLRLYESGSLDVSPLNHEQVGAFEKPGFTNIDRINGSFLEQELPSKAREQSDENQAVDEVAGTGEKDQGTFLEERNSESIESRPPLPEVYHHPPNETGEPPADDGKITEIRVPEVLPGKEIETEDVNDNVPACVVEPNIEHESVIGENDDSADAEEPEIITYRGRDLVEEGYRGNLPKVGLETEEEVKGKSHSVFVEESGGVEGDGLEKAIPSVGQFTEYYNIAEKKGEEIDIFSANEDGQNPLTEGGDEGFGQIKGTVEPQVSEASFPDEKVDVVVPREEEAPDFPSVKDASVDGLPSAEVSAPRDEIPNEDEIPKTSSNDDADAIDSVDHNEDLVQEDGVIGNDGLPKDRELTTIESEREEVGLPAPGVPSNGDSATHPEKGFAEGGKNESSEVDSTGITREITDQVAIERDDGSPDSNVYTDAIDGDPANEPFSVPELNQDEFQPDVAEKEATSGATVLNEFDIAGEEGTSSGLPLLADQTTKEYEEFSSRASSGEVIHEKAADFSTEQADIIPGRDDIAEAHSVKDDDADTRKEEKTLESTDREVETDNGSNPIKTEVPVVSDSLGDSVQQETLVITPEQESLTDTSAQPSVVENFVEDRNVSEEALSTLEDQPLDVPGASPEVNLESEESNSSEEVRLHPGVSTLTDAANEVSETQSANVTEALVEEKLDINQRGADLDTEISSAVPVVSNIDIQSASIETSNYEEASAAEVVVPEGKIPDEKISKKSSEQLKQSADEIEEDAKPTVEEGESERELDEVPDQGVLEDADTSARNVLNETFDESEADMITKQPHDMANQGDISLTEVPREHIEEAPIDTTIPSIDLKYSHSDEPLASNEEPIYEETSAAEVVTASTILEEKIPTRNFDGEYEAQIGYDADEGENYEETAPGKGNSAAEPDEVLAREEIRSVPDETTVYGTQQQGITNQTDIPLTEATMETREKATVYDSVLDASTNDQRDVSYFETPTQDQEQQQDIADQTDTALTLASVVTTENDMVFDSATDAFTNDQRDVSHFETLTQDQELETSKKQDESTNEEAIPTCKDDTKIDTQIEETPYVTLRETTDEVAPKIRENDSFGVTNEVSENSIDGQSASNEASNYEEALAAEVVVSASPILDETSTEEQFRRDAEKIDITRASDEILNGEEVIDAANTSFENTLNEKFEQLETEVSGELPHNIADQGDIILTEVPRELIVKDGVQTREEANNTKEHDEVPAREEVQSILDETMVDVAQQHDIADQTDTALTKAIMETTEKTLVYDSAIDAFADDRTDVSHVGTLTQDQELDASQKQDEPTNEDVAPTCQDDTKIDTQTETPETTNEVASKIQEDESFGVPGEVLKNAFDDQSASNEVSNYEEASAAVAVVSASQIMEEATTEEQLRQDVAEVLNEEVLDATIASVRNTSDEMFEQLEIEVSGEQPHNIADQGDVTLTEVPRELSEKDGVLAREEANGAREHDEVPAREEVPSVLDETVVNDSQQQDIADQTNTALTEASVETTKKDVVYDSASDAFTDDQIDVSHVGTLTQDEELRINKKQDEPTNEDAALTWQDDTKIDTQTEETPHIILRDTTDVVASKIQEDDNFGVTEEVSENSIDIQSASNAASNYEEASVAVAVVSASQIVEETSKKEQLRQDTDARDNAWELNEILNREEVLETTNMSAGNGPNENSEQLETEVRGEQPHDMSDQGDIAQTEFPREPIEKDDVDMKKSLVNQKHGHGDDQLSSNEGPKHGESSVAEAVAESEILEEKILTRSFNDSLVAQIGQNADKGINARELDEVPTREEVPSVLDETIVDGVQQLDISDQTDIVQREAAVEITEKAVVSDSATDSSTNDQRDISHFETLTQDQELKINKEQHEPTDDDAVSTCRDFAKIDMQAEETPDITLSETTDKVASMIQDDGSFVVVDEVLENPINESVISPDETIKSKEILGEGRDVEQQPALGQDDEGSSLVDDSINENEGGTVSSSEFKDVADSVQEIKEDSLQTEDVDEPLTGTDIIEDKDPTDIAEKDLIDGMEINEKINAGEVALETKGISSREVEQYDGESASCLQVGFSETPESELSFDQTTVIDQTKEQIKEIYETNDRDGEIADSNIHQSNVNASSDEKTKEEKEAEEVDSNIVSGTEACITHPEHSQISRDMDIESFEERNSVTENTENKESFYDEGKYNIESKDRAEEVTRSEEIVDAKETSNEAVFFRSELVESAVAEKGILDQGVAMENSYEQDCSLVPPEENEVKKDQEVPLGAVIDPFSEKQEQDKEAKEPYEEISHPEQRDLVDITEADYNKGTASSIPADTQEMITLEGDIQTNEVCIKNKEEATENEGIHGLAHEGDQQDAQGILAEEVALEGEVTSKDVETDLIVQEDEKDNKEAENSKEANDDEINKDGEVDLGSSTNDEELLATAATEMVDLGNKDSYTTADNLHVEGIEGEKGDLNLSNEIATEGDSSIASADTPFSEISISDNQPGTSSEHLDGENAGELNAAAESVEDVADKEEVPIDLEGHVVEATGQRELIIAKEVSDEAALSDTWNETATTLQTQPRDHSYEQGSVESALADNSMIGFNRENVLDRQDKTSDEQSSQVEINNPDLGTDMLTKDVSSTAENVEIYLAESNKQTARPSDVGEQKRSDEAFFQTDRVDNSLPPEVEVGGIENNEVLENETEATTTEEAQQLAHYTKISSNKPSDEMSAFSISAPNDVQEREIREIVAADDDQRSRTILEVSEHPDIDGVASADAEAGTVKTTLPTESIGNLEDSIGETSTIITLDENDDSNEESIVENQITSEQILELTDQQIQPIPSGKQVQEETEVVESAPIGKIVLDENPLLHASEKVSESEGIQSTYEVWSDGKQPALQTDISQDESDTSIPKYVDKEKDVTEPKEISPLEIGDRGFISGVRTKEISTDEDASKIKEVVSEDAGESIGDAVREVIPVISDTKPSMSSEYVNGENAGELNPAAVPVEDGAWEEKGIYADEEKGIDAGEEKGIDVGIEEASEAHVDSTGKEEESIRQRELINATEVSPEPALSDVPDETTTTIQTVPADDLYERDFVELTEDSKVHVESAIPDGLTMEGYGNTEQDIEDKTSNEQTSQLGINNQDLSADIPTMDVLATAENVEIDRAAFDEETRSSDIFEQKNALIEEVEQDRSRELSTSEEAFIQTDQEDISLPPEVEVGGSESNEFPQKEDDTEEGGSVEEEAPQFAHSMAISLDGPSDQIPALRASVSDNVQEITTPEIVASEDDQTDRTILKELDEDSGNKVEHEDNNAENMENEISAVHTQEYASNEERPEKGVFVEETLASDQLTQEEESRNNRSGEDIGEVGKDVYTDVGGVVAAAAVVGIVKPSEPTESAGNLENENIGEMGKTVGPEETDDSKEESFVEPIPHEEAVTAETKDIEQFSVGESTLDQSPLAEISQEESTLLHARTEAWSDGNKPTLQTSICQDESDSSMINFADKERDVQESEKITTLELGNRDFAWTDQTKVVLTEEDTSKTKEVVSEGAGGSVHEGIREVIPVTADSQPSMSSEYLDTENGGELNSAAVSFKEEGTDAGIEETSEALIDSKGHEVEAPGQRYPINTIEVSNEAALLDGPNEMTAKIQTVPAMDSSTAEFDGENEKGETFNEQASQVKIDNQDLAADMPTRDVPATIESVEIDRAEFDEKTEGIGRSLPPEAETGGNEGNQVLQNEAETKEEFSGEEALQSTEISSDGPSDQRSAFSTSVPDTIQEREIHEIVALEDDQTNKTIQEELDHESRNKVGQGDNAEKVEQEFTSDEERLVRGESVEDTISSDQLTQSAEQESKESLGGDNVSEVIKDVYADIGGVPSADVEAGITKTTQPTQSTGNLEESITETSTSIFPDENYDSKERSFIEPVPQEAVLAETEDVEQASAGESTLEQNPLADESTLLHSRTEVWSDGNQPTLQTDLHQDESDNNMPKYAEKERYVPATGKIAPLELGYRDFSPDVPTKEILTEEDASKTEEVETVDVAADDTKEQPSVTTEETILQDKEVQDNTGQVAGKPEDTIEIYGDKIYAAASVVNAKTTIAHGNEESSAVGESVDNIIGEVNPMTSDNSSSMPKEEEMLSTETEHEKENVSMEISHTNLTDTADLKCVNINEMATDIPSTDGQVVTGSVSYLPQGSIDEITAARVDHESASLALPSEETVADKAWTTREFPEAEHFEVGFKETGTGDNTAEKYGESRSLDFTIAQADQETKDEINSGEILSDGYAADKADHCLGNEAVEIADKVDPSLKEKEEKAFDEAQILQEKASQEQDEYKQGAADDEGKAAILSNANDPVEGAPLEEAEGQTFDNVKGISTDRNMETPVPNVQGSSEEIIDRRPSIEESKGLNQVIALKEDASTAFHDFGLPRDASLAKEVAVDSPGSTERGLLPAEAREVIDQSEFNLDSKEFQEEKFAADTTTVVPRTPVADNLELPEQFAIIKPDEDDDHEDDDHEHSDAAPLMAESSKDVVDGKARHKKSHNHLLSGMSSRVKSSISKVKKVITGKSSNHNKEHSPKSGQ